MEAIRTIADGLEQLQRELETVWLLKEGRYLREWLDRATVEQQRVLLRALVNPDGGGSIVVYPPPSGCRPAWKIPEGWEEPTKITFRLDVGRILTALETLGALKSRGKDHREGSNFAPAENGSDYTSGAGPAQRTLTGRRTSRRMPRADRGGNWGKPWT